MARQTRHVRVLDIPTSSLAPPTRLLDRLFRNAIVQTLAWPADTEHQEIEDGGFPFPCHSILNGAKALKKASNIGTLLTFIMQHCYV